MRLFVAVPLGPVIGAAVAHAIATTRLAAPTAKWASPEGVHLTLSFLGGVSSDRVPAITTALMPVAARHQPFAIEAGAAGIFGRASSPRVLGFGIGGDRHALAALQRDVSAGSPPSASRQKRGSSARTSRSPVRATTRAMRGSPARPSAWRRSTRGARR